VRTFGLGDQRERVAAIGGEWALGGEDLQSGADLDGAVVAGGAYEPADRPAGALLYATADRERGGHDGQVCVDGLALVVVIGRAARSCLDIRNEASRSKPDCIHR
jgi:hypothetical protein